MSPFTANINHLFATACRFFPDWTSAVTEAVQNAYRSYYPLDPASKGRISIKVTPGPEGSVDLTVEDYGCGITDLGVALSASSSSWGADVARDQDPAGLGMFALLGHSTELTIVSKFGRVRIDSKKFCTDPAYRETVPGLISASADDIRQRGTLVTLHGVKLPEANYYEGSPEARLRTVVAEKTMFYRTAEIYLDGHLVQNLLDTKAECVAEGDGFKVYAGQENSGIHKSVMSRTYYSFVVWHGHSLVHDRAGMVNVTVDGVDYKVSTQHMILDVTGEHLITPRLPDRLMVIEDEKTTATLAAAAKLFGEAMVRKALATAECLNQMPSLTVDDYVRAYKAFDRFDLANVVKSKCKFKRYVLNAIHRVRSSIEMEHIMLHGDYAKTYRLSNSMFVFSNDVVELSDCGDGTLLMDDSNTDVIYEIDGYIQSSHSENALVFVTSAAYRGNRSITEIKDTECLHVYAIPYEKLKELDFGGHASAAEACQLLSDNDATLLECSDHLNSLHVVDCDPKEGGVYSGLITTSVEEAEALYSDEIFSQLISYGSLDESQGHLVEEHRGWAAAIARLNNESLVELPNRWSLEKDFGKVFTLDLKESTITKADGTVCKVSFYG
jgi:anti-sigma regulatory factor (Ser/Thr protein kinase)